MFTKKIPSGHTQHLTFYLCFMSRQLCMKTCFIVFFFPTLRSSLTRLNLKNVSRLSCRQPLSQPRNQPCKKEQRTNWNFHFFLRFLFVQKPRNPRHVLRVHFFSHILRILKSHAVRRNFLRWAGRDIWPNLVPCPGPVFTVHQATNRMG
jgi:hypothetical protein